MKIAACGIARNLTEAVKVQQLELKIARPQTALAKLKLKLADCENNLRLQSILGDVRYQVSEICIRHWLWLR